MSNYIRCNVKDCEAGMRLDQFLASKEQLVSRSQAQRLLKSGNVLVNGVSVSAPSRKVYSGQSIQLTVPENVHGKISPEDREKAVNNFNNNTSLHIGPITLAMHFNPYGEKLVNNETNIPIEMSNKDPRHDSLFGLAWSTAMFTELIDSNTKYLTFNSLFGFNGILSKETKEKRPLFFLNELLLFFKDYKIKKIEKINNIYGLKVYNNKDHYLVLVNLSKTIKKINLKNFIIKKICKINDKNFSTIKENKFSFLNLETYDFDDNMQPLEIRLMILQ